MKETIVTLEDIIEQYVMGSRLTGFVKENDKLAVKIYHVDGDAIEHLNLDKETNELIIDNKVRFKLECMSTPNGEIIKVGKILLTDNTRRKLYIFVESAEDDTVEYNAVDVLLLTRLLCALANKKLDIYMFRYINKDDYRLGNTGCSIVVGSEFKNMPRPEYPESTDALYIPNEYDGNIKELVKTLKGLLRIDRKISYLRVYKIYSEYKRGMLMNKNFVLWSMAYTKFYHLSPERTPLFLLELLANDYNTKVIVSYLVSRYKTEWYKKKKRTIPLELTNFHPDITYVVGSSKYKADLFYSRIKRNYINSIFVQNTESKPVYSYMLDINGLLSVEEMKKYTDLLVYVIQFVKEDNGLKVVVNLPNRHKEGMIACFNSTPILKNLETTFRLKSMSVEFNPID